MNEIEKRALIQQLEANATAYELLGEKELPLLLRRAVAALTPPEGYEQPREAHFVCEAPGPGYWQISVEGKPYNFRAPKGFKLVPDNGPQIPEGYVLVPVVPTKAMVDASVPAASQDQTGRRQRAVWDAMLAARSEVSP